MDKLYHHYFPDLLYHLFSHISDCYCHETKFATNHPYNIPAATVMFVIISFKFQVGDKVPSVDLFEKTPANKVNLSSLCEGKKVVVFGVPGAFTPGCSKVNAI